MPTPTPHATRRPMSHLNDEEAFLVDTVRAFINRDVKPTVRDVEHANEYPERWIEQMKELGIFGLAVPEEYGGMPVSMPCYAQVTEELARGWMSLAATPSSRNSSPTTAPRNRNRPTSPAWPPANSAPPWPSPNPAAAPTCKP